MKRFKDILYVAQAGKQSKSLMERVISLATSHQARLTVVDAIEVVTAGIGMPDGGPISAELQRAMVRAHTEGLQELIEPHRERMEIQSRVLQGTPFLEVIREVLRNGHDLVIKSPETSDWLDRLIGSDDMHLLRNCPCPVWLIKAQSPKKYRRILAAIDVHEMHPSPVPEAMSALNREILEKASSLALSDFAELNVVHAWDAVGESAMRCGFLRRPEDEVDAYVERLRVHSEARISELVREVVFTLGQDAVDYLRPQIHLVKGQARKEIPALAKRLSVDLVVMGTVARTGIPGFIMGNTAETILSQIDCSVLAIKPSGFVTPVTLVD